MYFHYFVRHLYILYQSTVPPNIVDKETSEDIEVNEGQSASIKCVATGYPAPDIIFRRQGIKDNKQAAHSFKKATSKYN